MSESPWCSCKNHWTPACCAAAVDKTKPLLRSVLTLFARVQPRQCAVTAQCSQMCSVVPLGPPPHPEKRSNVTLKWDINLLAVKCQNVITSSNRDSCVPFIYLFTFCRGRKYLCVPSGRIGLGSRPIDSSRRSVLMSLDIGGRGSLDAIAWAPGESS